jgi:Protein of unknown function (DUF2612)
MSITTSLDHTALGLSRVGMQYREAAKFHEHIKAILQPGAGLEAVLLDISRSFDIDWVTGVRLDIIGDVVGVSRFVPFAIPAPFFGFAGQAGALPYGEYGGGSGGWFREEHELATGSSVLEDPEYRLLVKAKIVKNHSRGTGEDVIAGLVYLFPHVPIIVQDDGDMAFSVGIGRALTYSEKSLLVNLDILARPSTVRISQKFYFSGGYFGFEGQANAMTFGEEGSQFVGGIFSEEF